MTILSEHRIEKLEGALLAELKPADRVCAVLKALAEGRAGLAMRLVELCPRGDYTMTDPAYSERLRNVAAIGLIAVGTFEKYAFAFGQIEKVKNLMAQGNVAAIMPSDFHDAVLDAVVKGGKGEKVGWDHLIVAGQKLQAEGSALLVHFLTTWQAGLEQRLRAEWMGFDAFCRTELHLDAFTLLRGLKLGLSKDFLIEESARAERPADASDGESDMEMRELAGKIEASWRESFRSLDNSTARRNKTGGASGT